MQGQNLDSVEDEEIRVEVGNQQCAIQSVSSGQVCIYIKKESFITAVVVSCLMSYYGVTFLSQLQKPIHV